MEGTQSYSLNYLVQHDEYNLTLTTGLEPLNSDTYNRSLTLIDYIPAGKSVESVEFVEFNSSVTLSEQYAVLGKVANEVGKVYKKNGDENLAQLAQGYHTMEKEAKYLSRLVRIQLPEYNREILQSFGLLRDVTCKMVCELLCLFGIGAGCNLICFILCGVDWRCIGICGGVCTDIIVFIDK